MEKADSLNTPLNAWREVSWGLQGYKSFNYSLPLQRPLPPLTVRQAEELDWFERRYDIIANEIVRSSAPARKLGEGLPLICRYCKRSEPDVTFENDSHAFPHMIGNETLIDCLECDDCNEHFSKLLDGHFGEWSLHVRGPGLVQGKKGVPTVVSADKDQRVRMEVNRKTRERTIQVRYGAEGVGFDFDQEKKTVSWDAHQKPYIPVGVYKSFVKMALSVMPAEEFSRCGALVKWILEKNHSLATLGVNKLPPIFTEFCPGPIAPNQFVYVLLRRKADVPADCPHMMFVLQFSNLVSQVILPLREQDQALEGKTLKIRLFPHPWSSAAYVAKYGRGHPKEEDLSSVEKTAKGEKRRISMSYHSLVQRDLTKPDEGALNH